MLYSVKNKQQSKILINVFSGKFLPVIPKIKIHNFKKNKYSIKPDKML